MVNYPIGDFLIRIKNTALAGKREVNIPATNLIREVARLLEKEGFLENVSYQKSKLMANVTYKNKMPVLLGLRLVSKPGLRIYTSCSELKKRKGSETLLISTPKGVMTQKEAIKKTLGGEIIAEVW
ncbi:30S ribosomal protein S8 [Candidatus Woesebacteria bacterium RIFCSPHIGHO2_01_FULL_39_28]|uniref:Small ribosomal subunit protein uS8 n=1 Tax=Candidatus Woesebacteria bacterium RIFCSPHIGHO2_01_FULL_39_28 TaxID=1802496 RepID=A0A1F7YA40_9BACT|nr:MAG: 30S ribosomal protein S8 [Candidatus Woesebacteria bacterium RIFCSPHIGHO2_01_FULL_39_28]OGM58462.1 MAG: 30S ribosomal protein S8 [Candidatus Woesebacteria bacterium RIFCSPLOWO2_01_FULL_38_20]